MVPIETAQLLLDTLRLPVPGDTEPLRARWEHVDGRGVAELMVREGGELWLHRRLKQIGVHETAVARTEFWKTLDRSAKTSVAQNLLLKTHAEYVASLLVRAGVPHIPIKGLARQACAEQLPFADCRATRDVDLLVPRDAADAAWQCLVSNGYRQSSDLTPEGHFHLPPLANDEEIAVEIHTSTSSFVPPEEAWRRAQNVADPTELLWQGVTHAMDQGLEAYFLRYYLDAAVALNRADDISWDTVIDRLHSVEIRDYSMALTWLLTANRFTTADLPVQIERPSRDFPLLRTAAWRLATYRSRFRNKAWTRKLLAEGLRSEFEMKLEGPVPSTPLVHKMRRTTSAAAARLTYRTWRRLRWKDEPNAV